MKRYTMTPISRKMQKLPIAGNKTPIKPRPSLMPEDNKKRDIKMIRDANYKKTCTDNVFKFLSENNFEGNISQKTLQNPSSKDFQLIFKFIFSFIDDYDYSSKFEDDVIVILKIIKYPYASEINRSQLTAITPHIWPIVLSMLSWMVDLLLSIENQFEHDNIENSISSLFNEFVRNGYINYLQGNDEDSRLEEEFETKVQDLYSDFLNNIDKRKSIFENLENEIKEARKGLGGVEKLEQKKNDILNDLNSLILSQKQLESKKSRYLHNINKAKEEIEQFESEIENLKAQQSQLEIAVENQKINPSDLKCMNKEKVELYKDLEKITSEKEKLMLENKELENCLMTITEELERLNFDFNSLRNNVNVELLVNTDNQGHCKNVDEIRRLLENEHTKCVQRYEELKIDKDTIMNAKEEKEMILKDIETKIESNQNKLVATGEIYLKKKIDSEEEQKKSKNQMDGLERELLQLNLESNSALIQSEQGLHKSQISLDIISDKYKQEKDVIKNIIYNFQNNMNNNKLLLKRINEKLHNLKTIQDQQYN